MSNCVSPLKDYKNVVGRYAPTPSGRLHLGNLFSMMLVWFSARSKGGKVTLRIENLDEQRCKTEYYTQLLQDLNWIGLDWDWGPLYNKENEFMQNKRQDFYMECLYKLENMGLIYPCYCSRTQLHTALAPHQSDGIYIYNGNCFGLSKIQTEKLYPGKKPAYRIHVPNEEIGFEDGCQGFYSENLSENAGDYIIRRSDLVFAYQLAAPADDGNMGITEVVRGRDLLSSTPRQIWLLKMLGYSQPKYYHHPLLINQNGRRLAKRDADLHLDYLKEKNPSPEYWLGVLGFWAGLIDRPEPVSIRDLLAEFCWSKVPKEDIQINYDNLQI